jgi:hypothetical protein
MELKEFVKETLLQLTEGVKEAQEKCRKHGGLVNPMLGVPRSIVRKTEIQDKYYPITDVGFKVGLTENTGAENKKGLGVFLPNISLGAEQKKDTHYQSITSIEFNVPILLPFIGRDGEYVDVSGFFH